MRLTCPACSAAYEVSPILLAGRQAVRCARCGHQWSSPVAEERALVPLPIADLPNAEAAPAPANYEWEDRRRPEPRHGRTGLWFAWLLTFVVIAVGVWAGVSFRSEVMLHWPPSARAYAAVGLAVPAPSPPGHTPH
ncbi:MAG: zinc-ribbon domain-containing protein [Acetobacteraceae bacterium]